MIQLNANHIWYLVTAAQWTVLLSLLAFAGGAFVGLAEIAKDAQSYGYLSFSTEANDPLEECGKRRFSAG